MPRAERFFGAAGRFDDETGHRQKIPGKNVAERYWKIREVRVFRDKKNMGTKGLQAIMTRSKARTR